MSENDEIVEQNELNDFGNKIGGAKKDLYGNHSLSTELEINKKNLWPQIKKSNYKEISNEVFDFIKNIRKNIPNKPVSKDNYHEEKYTRFIDEIRNIVEKVNPRTTIKELQDEIQLNLEKNKNNYENYLVKKMKTSLFNFDNELDTNSQSLNTNKFISKINEKYIFLTYIKGTNWTLDAFEHGTLKVFYDNQLKTIEETEEFPKEKFLENTVYVLEKETAKIVGFNYKTVDEAKDYFANLIKDELLKTKEDKENNGIKLNPLTNIERVGQQYRENNIVPDKFIKDFPLYGVEFGNWITKGERQDHLNIAYDSLKDLCKVLNISNNDVTLNNRLSLAFGSRGSGKIYAHYEPKYKVINLTRYLGAGSLSHEYAHALDHYLANVFHKPGVFFSESDHPLAQKLMNTMIYKETNAKEILEFNQDNYEKMQYQNKDYLWNIFKNDKGEIDLTYNESLKLNKLVDKYVDTNITQEDYDKVYGIFRENNDYPIIINEISNLYYDVKNIELETNIKEELTKKQKDLYASKLQVESKTGKTKTDFYYNSGLIDYYQEEKTQSFSSKHEMFARAFACYVSDKMEENNEKNDYLNGHCNGYEYKKEKRGKSITIAGYPQNEERKEINKQFDILFDKLKEINLFKGIENNKENNDQQEKKSNLEEAIKSKNNKINDLRGEQLGIYDKIHAGKRIPNQGKEI